MLFQSCFRPSSPELLFLTVLFFLAFGGAAFSFGCFFKGCFLGLLLSGSVVVGTLGLLPFHTVLSIAFSLGPSTVQFST